MGSKISLCSSISLTLIKLDPEIIGSRRKVCDMLPLLYSSILYHHTLPLSILWIYSESALQNLCHPGYDKIFSFADPFKPVLLRCIIYLVLEGGRKSTNIGLLMGATIEGDASKSGKNTHLSVIMSVRREDIQPVYTGR